MNTWNTWKINNFTVS